MIAPQDEYNFLKDKLQNNEFLKVPKNNEYLCAFLEAKKRGGYKRIIYNKPCSYKTLVKKARNVVKVEEYFNKGKIKVELTKDNLINTEKDFSTNVDWIFAGGDCVKGPSTVVETIQQGKKAASEIDKYLGGDGVVVKKEETERKISSPILEEQKSRVKMPTILLSERKRGFKEVEKGYSLDQAVEEASRCLRCDVKEKEEVI